MKIFLLPALLASLTACGQQRDLDRFYDKYKSNDALTTQISINPSLLMSVGFSDTQNNAWKDKVSKFRLFILDAKKVPSAAEDIRDLFKRLQQDHYDELITVHKGTKGGQLLCKDLAGDHRDLVLFVRGDDDGLIFAEVEGRFTEKDLDAIRGSVQ
ncbi:DUF4252 domain-containing protein [Dinghuibacter silviterrae]|uniref:Uncharacterized protein DUF4252 n=1 Tax=Dinghuibacter silviterrae TaxID=1539049 RepID=A0A4R8DEX8_9BACT|nr:DUF4252 domain-containing protein [Dinghuibacter silviterrae]TDW95957.1 uncharacterized protein DUF4252 [Dinghuibacter silviterrae]